MEKIVIIGNGGHAKVVVDSLEKMGAYEIAGFVAKAEQMEFSYRGYNIIGTDEQLKEIYESGVRNAVVAIGYIGKSDIRSNIYKKLQEVGFILPTIIDPTAIVAEDVQIGEGTYVGKKCVINAAAKVGKMAIINTGAIVEHECQVDDFVHIAVSTVLCGNVYVKKNAFVGANATILQGITVGANAIVGAGSVIKDKVDDYCTVVGVPGRVL